MQRTHANILFRIFNWLVKGGYGARLTPRILLTFFLVSSCDQSTGPTKNECVGEASYWECASPEEVGLDQELLEAGDEFLRSVPYVHSVLVIKDDALVFERYYNGNWAEREHNIYSVTKSILSVLVGIAIEQGYISGLDLKAMDYFQEYANLEGLDARTDDITLEHLITMRGGFESEGENMWDDYINSPDWFEHLFQRDMVDDPGARMHYTSFSSHMIAKILVETTGQSVLSYAEDNLFTPLGIDVAEWNQDPLGYEFGGANLWLTPREMARFGYMALKGGTWGNQRIVSENWLEQSAQYITRWRDDYSWGAMDSLGYGYHWWLGNMHGHPLRMALGYGGQLILIFRELDMIVVTQANGYIGWDQIQDTDLIEWVSDYVLAGVDLETATRSVVRQKPQQLIPPGLAENRMVN
jgi:CubicO group peptidase (beta-lactamase class C family)